MDFYPFFATLPDIYYDNKCGPIPGIVSSLQWNKLALLLISKKQQFSESILNGLLNESDWDGLDQLKAMGHPINKAFRHATDEETIDSLAALGFSPLPDDIKYILRIYNETEIFDKLYSLFPRLFVFTPEEYSRFSTIAIGWCYCQKILTADQALLSVKEGSLSKIIDLFSTDELMQFYSTNRLHHNTIRFYLRELKKPSEKAISFLRTLDEIEPEEDPVSEDEEEDDD